jgi:hypothetical protein
LDVFILLVVMLIGYVASEYGKAVMLRRHCWRAHDDVVAVVRLRRVLTLQLLQEMEKNPFLMLDAARNLMASVERAEFVDSASLAVVAASDKMVAAALAVMRDALVMPAAFGTYLDEAHIRGLLTELDATEGQLESLVGVVRVVAYDYNRLLEQFPLVRLPWLGLRRWV